MMNKKQTLKRALKTYYADKALSDRQLALLQQTLGEQGAQASSRRGTAKWLGLSVASLALLVLSLVYLQIPAVITDAYVDIKKDASIYNGMPASMLQWMTENQIAPVPSQYPVEMSKFCRLEQYLTTHLRIAGAQQGVLHLFFHRGESPFQWRNRAGVIDQMNWKLLKVQDNLTLIVLYSHDMREEAVQHILAQMLSELPVNSISAATFYSGSGLLFASM